jgi:hypothetical protein
LRAVMGVGAAIVFPNTLSILSNVFTNRTERAKMTAPIYELASRFGIHQTTPMMHLDRAGTKTSQRSSDVEPIRTPIPRSKTTALINGAAVRRALVRCWRGGGDGT